MDNQIRPWALGRSNWLFAGSLRSGQRAAAIQSAKLNEHDPYACLKDVLTRLPTQKNNAIVSYCLTTGSRLYLTRRDGRTCYDGKNYCVVFSENPAGYVSKMGVA